MLAGAGSPTALARSRSRAALREGLDALPAAQLDGPELDLRLLVDHRQRLVRQRVALNNTLQWHLHDSWPELRLPGSSLFYGNWARASPGGSRALSRLPRCPLRPSCADDAVSPKRSARSATTSSLPTIGDGPGRPTFRQH